MEATACGAASIHAHVYSVHTNWAPLEEGHPPSSTLVGVGPVFLTGSVAHSVAVANDGVGASEGGAHESTSCDAARAKAELNADAFSRDTSEATAADVDGAAPPSSAGRVDCSIDADTAAEPLMRFCVAAMPAATA